jgi:predicted ATPase
VKLLERQDQLAQLAGAVERAADGSGSVVLVRGDGGIGTTTLVRHFVNRQTAGADTRWGCCDDLLTPHPFGPLWEVAASEPGLLVALRRMIVPRVFRSVLEFVSGIDRPAVLVIEDAHWADEATLDLIKHVGRRIGERRGVLIVTCRDVGMSGRNMLSAVVGDLPNEVVVRVSLPTLTEGAVRELARSSGQAGAGLTRTERRQTPCS